MFECDTCNKNFSKKASLKRHIKSVHDKIKDFQCTLCDYKSSTNGHLQRHIKAVHLKIKDFECDLCDFKCCHKGDLQQHIKSVHDKIRNDKCNLCDCKFSSKSNLQQHIKSVHYKIKFDCDRCDYKCSRKGSLQQHVKSVHNKIKDFQCNLCNYSCSTNGHLQRHIKSVHLKIKDFECDLCNYKSSTNGHLQQHIQICTGQNTRFSGGEYKVFQALHDLGIIEDIDYYFNTTFDKLTEYSGKHLRPDFRFIKHNIIIEYDGIQHFEARTFGGMSQTQSEENLEQTKQNDKIKDDFCVNNDFKMIRINYKQFPDILTILSTELHNIIDWTG